MVYCLLKNLWWPSPAYCVLTADTLHSHWWLLSLQFHLFLHISSALVHPIASAVLSFKPSTIKEQQIPYSIAVWLQLSTSVIPLLCTRLSELPLPRYERAQGGK